ncbi:iron ABC transporter permease [Auritidibacter ignavus]|uniref:Iron ABC transporter permease n=1 Tax=Auritidibacter ignavus TaxID=678932 RepID=A0AAJ6AGE5_9MICC|nr:MULTISPECIES: iron ABC transporter permease [Auritidibacter]PXA78471.1 iron ABC transporter permease [Auritidibacter sp. NML120779]AXR74768.1 iron ABC transporter permease [Auritidibacter sp. NML130574]PXA79440.1 iron ABC transporter permease [Auritidibacter sp. NML120636]WGH81306.1 iron ABC transporter permease [Auritidibacter ignavus]WGH92886.1 iron ABC transporter permease [Auritidibacter ignavus]
MSRFRWIVWVLVALLPLAFLAVFFAWPVLGMLARGLVDDQGSLDLSGFGEVFGTARTWRIIGHTLFMATAGTLGSLVLGIPGAYILYRTQFPGREMLRSVATVPFVLPTVVVGVAFRAVFGPGTSLAFLDQTTTAVIIAMMFFNYSVVIRQVGSLWQVLDPRSTEAARMLGASPARAFFTVTLPALRPAIAGSAGLVFLFCSTAYGLVRSLGAPGVGTLETEVFRQTKTFLDLRTAAVLSMIQCVIVVISVIITQRTGSSQAARLHQAHRVRLTRTDWFPLTITLAVVLGLILTPLLTLVARSLTVDGEFSTRHYQLLATHSGTGFAGGATVVEALDHSLRIALDATIVTVLLAIPLALLLTRPTHSPAVRSLQRLIDGAFMLPLGVSAVTIGFGFLISLQPAFPHLAQSGLLVPLAQAVVALPLVVRTLVPVLAAVDPAQREAATMLGASPVRVIATIDGPYVVRSLGLAAGFGFAVSLGEFGATSFLASPSYQTLPVVIVQLLSRPGSDNFGMAMAGSVVLAVLSAGILLICERLRPAGVKERTS